MEGTYRKIDFDAAVGGGVVNLAYEAESTGHFDKNLNREWRVNFENGATAEPEPEPDVAQTETEMESTTTTKPPINGRRPLPNFFAKFQKKDVPVGVTLETAGGSKAPRPAVAVAVKTLDDEPSTFWTRHRGFVFAFVGSISIRMAIITVIILRTFHPFTLGLYRFVSSTIFTIPLVLYYQYVKKEPIYASLYPFDLKSRDQWMLVATFFVLSIFNMLAFIFRVYTVKFVTVADGTLFSLSGGVFVIILGCIFLGDKFNIAAFLVALFPFSSVFVLSRPPLITGENEFQDKYLIGAAYGIAGMVSAAVCVIILRKSKTIHFLMLLLIPNVLGIFHCVFFMWLFGADKFFPETRKEAIVLPALCILFFVGALAVIFASKYESPVSASLIRSGDIFLAFLLQYILLSVLPDIFTLIGAVIVISGVLLSTFRIWVVRQPSDSRVKQIFKFIL